MCALDGLNVEVQGAGFRVGANGGVARVGEGAGLPIAEASDIVFVSAECLVFCGSGKQPLVRGCEKTSVKMPYLSL